MVADVFYDDTYWATAGEGAWSTSGELSVAEASLGDSLIGTGFPYDRRSHAAEYLRAARRCSRSGATSGDGCAARPGRGRCRAVRGFWEYGLGQWDVAAGILLVREAGVW